MNLFLPILSVPPIALGKPATIPAKIIKDIPFTNTPFSNLFTKPHKNIVPATKVETVVNRNKAPGSITNPA